MVTFINPMYEAPEYPPVLILGYEKLTELLFQRKLTITQLENTVCLFAFMESSFMIAGRMLSDFAGNPQMGAELLSLFRVAEDEKRILFSLQDKPVATALIAINEMLEHQGFIRMSNASAPLEEELCLGLVANRTRQMNPKLVVYAPEVETMPL